MQFEKTDSSLHAFPILHLRKKLHQNKTLGWYASASWADALGFCLLGKLFSLSKSLLSRYSILTLKRVSKHPAGRRVPSERQQTPLQIHQKASSAGLRTDYPLRIVTNHPQRTRYHKPSSCARRLAFRSTKMILPSALYCWEKAKEANWVHFNPSFLDLQAVFLTPLSDLPHQPYPVSSLQPPAHSHKQKLVKRHGF